MGIFSFLKRKTKNKIVFLGLDKSGKSTIISFLQTGRFVEHTPTMGKKKSNIEVQGTRISLFDMGGQTDFRKLWNNELSDAKVVVFVVDVADEKRFDEAKKELHSLKTQIQKHNIDLIILANKIDLPNKVGRAEVIQQLDLDEFENFKILQTSAKTGYGMADAFAQVYTSLTGELVKRNSVAKAISLYDKNGHPIIIKASDDDEYDKAVIQGSFLSAITSFLQQTHAQDTSHMKIDLGDKMFFVSRKNGFIGALFWNETVDVPIEEAEDALNELLEHLEQVSNFENEENVKFHFEQYCSNLL